MEIAIDFDGTVVTHEYPKIGEDIGAVPWIKEFIARGAKIILFTMRDGDELKDAVNWYKKHGIELYGVNINPTQHKWTASNKAYAHVYVDDCAIGVPLVYDFTRCKRPYVDWRIVGDLVLELLDAWNAK